MQQVFNIYIDESCHLEKDDSEVMCIGYIKLDFINYLQFKDDIKKIKIKHKSPTEIKWNRVSESRLPLYKELIDYFFKNEIFFRCVLIKNKHHLGHERYNRNDENSYYYKTLKILLENQSNESKSRVYLDKKDHYGKGRLALLKNDLDKSYKEDSPYIYFQHIHSVENVFLQLTDLFIGAVCYKARKLYGQPTSSSIKNQIVDYLEYKSKYSLDDGTEPWEKKFSIYDFQIKPISND